MRGTRFLAYLVDMSRLLRSVRLVLHLVRRIIQRFLRYVCVFKLGGAIRYTALF
jgi:hypothetical protein